MFLLLTLLGLITAGSASAKDPLCTTKWFAGKKSVDCSGKGLTSIPETLDASTQVLIMDNNPLENLVKDAFKSANLLNLQKISLRSCQLRDIHENAFRDLKILIELDISMNNLTKLRPKTFDGNDNLKTLKAGHNPIRGLVAYQFPPLRNLKTLDFSHCRIETVDKKAFQNLGAGVESLHLDHNSLRYSYYIFYVKTCSNVSFSVLSLSKPSSPCSRSRRSSSTIIRGIATAS